MNYLVEGGDSQKRKLKIISLQQGGAELLFEKEPTIGISHIRQIIKKTALKCIKPQTLVIDQAEKMTIPAQNSFLKLLEEPPPNISFILELTIKTTFYQLLPPAAF